MEARKTRVEVRGTGGQGEKGEKKGPDVGHESSKGPGWTSDLRELIKYAGDLSSLHPRGHPGGTPV